MTLSAKERRGLELFAKRGSHWARDVHGHTIHALERKGLIGFVHGPAGEAALVVPNIFDDLFAEKAAMKPTPSSPDALTVVPGREVTYHDPSARTAKESADRLKAFVAGTVDPRRDIAIANAVLDVLRDSSLSEEEAITLSKRVMAAIAGSDRSAR